MRVLADATFVRREQVKKQKINDTIKVRPGKSKLFILEIKKNLHGTLTKKEIVFLLLSFLYMQAGAPPCYGWDLGCSP